MQEQIEKTKEEVLISKHFITQVEAASPKDIEEIREELMEEGYITASKKNRKNAQLQNLY